MQHGKYSRRNAEIHLWTQVDCEEDFEKLVKDIWDKRKSDDPLAKKLEDLASSLSNWAKAKVGSLSREIKRVKKNLNKTLNEERKQYDATKISYLEARLEKLINQEEMH